MPWYGLSVNIPIPLTPDEIQGKADELTEMLVNEHKVDLETREIIYHAPGDVLLSGTIAVKIWAVEE